MAPTIWTFASTLRSPAGQRYGARRSPCRCNGASFRRCLAAWQLVPATLFNGQNLWLGVAVNGEAEMTPRIRIAPVAYSLFSDNADKLDESRLHHIRCLVAQP